MDSIGMLAAVAGHAFSCKETRCDRPNCARARRLIDHQPKCTVCLAGNCMFCKGYWMMLIYHSRQCGVRGCKVPHCERVKCDDLMAVVQKERMRKAVW
jgi:hypothetical protein